MFGENIRWVPFSQKKVDLQHVCPSVPEDLWIDEYRDRCIGFFFTWQVVIVSLSFRQICIFTFVVYGGLAHKSTKICLTQGMALMILNTNLS